jgi:hypothetical protein
MEPSAWHNWAILSLLGGVNTETWFSRLGQLDARLGEKKIVVKSKAVKNRWSSIQDNLAN